MKPLAFVTIVGYAGDAHTVNLSQITHVVINDRTSDGWIHFGPAFSICAPKTEVLKVVTAIRQFAV